MHVSVFVFAFLFLTKRVLHRKEREAAERSAVFPFPRRGRDTPLPQLLRVCDVIRLSRGGGRERKEKKKTSHGENQQLQVRTVKTLTSGGDREGRRVRPKPDRSF